MALFSQMEVVLGLEGAIIESYYNKDMEGIFEIPGEDSGYPVFSIGDGAFCDCRFVETMVIPDTVECIGANSFANCTFTELFVSKRIKRIHKTSFSGCFNLEALFIEEGDDIIVDCDDHHEIIRRSELFDYIKLSNTHFDKCI